MRRYLAAASLAMAVGLAAFLRFGPLGLAVLTAAGLLLGLAAKRRDLLRCLLCGLLCAGLLSGGYALRFAAAESAIGTEAPFTGTVLEVSPYTAHRCTVYARVAGKMRVIRLSRYLPEEETPLAGESIGGTLRVTGAQSEGDTLLLSGGVALTAQQLTADEPKTDATLPGTLLRLRRQTVQALQALGEDSQSALVIGMLTSETSALPAGLRSSLSAAGISHLLAVSGLHLSILIAVTGRLGELLLWSRRQRAAAAAGCCLLMAVLAGFRPSVLRAALMTGLALTGTTFGRRSDGLTSLGFASAVILLLNPAAVWELSFLLTCTATLGILLLARPLCRLWPAALRHRLGRTVWESLCVSLAAQLGTLPVTVLSFGYLPAYSLLTNLLVLPLVYLTLLFALLTLPCLAAGLGAIPFAAARFFAGGIAAVAGAVAKLPGAVLPCVAPWQLGPVLVFAGLLLAVLFLPAGRTRLRPLLGGCAALVVLAAALLPGPGTVTLAVDGATGSVLVQKGEQALLLEGTADGYEANCLTRFLQKCGNPNITVLAHPPERHHLTAELRLARLLEPELLLCDEETAALGAEQLPPGTVILPYCDTISNILSYYTLYEINGVGTVLQIGEQKVLKCWTGYDIITAEDIPPDVTAVIDRAGNLWLREGCQWPLCRRGGLTVTLPKEGAAP